MKREKLSNNILYNQVRYKNLRSRAGDELKILEEYFGKNFTSERLKYQSILFHLTAYQKEISYFGLRGVFVGVIAAILTYGFNTVILSEILKVSEETKLAGFITAILSTIIFVLIFYITLWEPFSIDRKRRDQLYINEYMIELVKDKINTIDSMENRIV
ncbi:hypothetical protein DS745_21490 [Anaerobacillus alkaliphilus]|uniref:Uncharacterized protein n=1 Tax=Anaerobacillus alkaliphilus TaxID=1548597 RepID=A0A4Q0VPP3_9BACI|nr:hypothetical protein [Anaerobacillus alkaliphilus]RXI96305.1 hypothetical protein DS745_21490 [Anaerobacillus alkaliphilus]